MSATEDASTGSLAPHARRSIVIALAAGSGLLAGALLAVSIPARLLPSTFSRYEALVPWQGDAPAAQAWPRPAARGERVTLAGSTSAPLLRIEGSDPGAVGLLAEQFERARLSGLDADRQRRARLRAAAQAEVASGVPAALTPAAECAALLRARVRVLRVLAPLDAPPEPGFEYHAPFLAAEVGISDASLAADPAALREAFAGGARLERAWLGREARGASDLGGGTLSLRWRMEQNATADRLAELATQIETPMTTEERDAIDLATSECVLELEPQLPDPAAALLSAVPPVLPEVERSPASRLALALAGGLMGAALLSTIAALGSRGQRRRTVRLASGDRSRRPVALDPAGAPAWLQLISGPDRESVARAVMEIAARNVARDERVLVIDGGRRFRLHLAFEGDPNLGLTDCLAGEFPALGLVQNGGAAGLRFLAYGDPAEATAWIALDRLLEEVRPHFDRVLMAVPLDAPHEAGGILAGRWMDAWWAGPEERLPRVALKLSDRMAIRFSPMHLRDTHEKPLELLQRRLREFAGERVRQLPIEVVAPIPAATPEPIPTPAEPVVLDSDLQVRERLRFLAWMRRVQAERHREPAEPVHRS